jgi:glutamine synthetase
MNSTRASPDEARDFLARHPEVRQVQMMFVDHNGVLRGKSLRAGELLALYERGRPMPSSIAALTLDGDDAENTGLLWEVGDMDCLAFPVAGTLVPTPWLATPTAQVLVMFDPELGMPAAAADPRLVARRAIERLHGAGFTPVMAVELEFYLLAGDAAARRPPRPAIPRGEHPHVYAIDEVESFAPFLDDVYRACEAQGLPAETAISEFGPGQLEITLTHRADALRALDEAVLYRRVVKGIAARHGFLACFMAKPFAKSAGSGTHLHLSLQDQHGRNLFASEDPAGSPLLRFAIGGMADTAADMMAVFAPHANSFRRYCANSYAPLFPTWGVNNRTVSLRVPTGPPDSRHVEHRICGADANPYLAAAAMLAGAEHGIAREIDPGEPVAGDGYRVADAPPLPVHWPLAIERFAQSAVARECFGRRFVEIYAAVKRTESQRFLGEVTSQDYDWYLQTV